LWVELFFASKMNSGNKKPILFRSIRAPKFLYSGLVDFGEQKGLTTGNHEGEYLALYDDDN